MTRLVIGLALSIITGISSILAGNISFGNNSQSFEYGQGVYRIEACDDWIRMNIVSGATGEFGAPAGLSALTGVVISSLDTKACAGTELTISAVDEQGDRPPMYATDGLGNMEIQIDSLGNLISTSSSDYIVDHDPITSNFTINFVNPRTLANSVGGLIVQTAPI